jgi:hypothetical protein
MSAGRAVDASFALAAVLPGTSFDACTSPKPDVSSPSRGSLHALGARCSHGLGLFALEVHALVCNGFRNGLQQALHVLQLWPSFIQPVSSQRRQTGSLRGGGAAVLITATCLLVSSSSRFPIAVVSSMIDPFIFCVLR